MTIQQRREIAKVFKPVGTRVEKGLPAANNNELFGVQKGKSIVYFPRYLDALVHKHEIKADRVFCTKVERK